eukprot:m.21398 g.21398  ORF g.21398 m.21398 type:complete len:320 (+) comp5682_c0_seq1:111-1070(+)
MNRFRGGTIEGYFTQGLCLRHDRYLQETRRSLTHTHSADAASRFKVGLDHRKMITSKADDRWMNRLLADADAAVEMLPPAAVAPGHVDARRLRIFSDAFDVFISRQHQLSDLCTLIKTEYETYLKGPTQRRLDPLDSPDSGGGDTVADSRELRAEIATLQARVHSLRAEATAAESDRERAVAEVKAAAPPFAQAGPAAAEQVGVAAESSTKERSSTKAELGPDCGPIGAMVREMASMEEEIAALEAEQLATGVPTRVLGWLDSNLNDVNKEIRLVQKQIEVLESQWFAGELDMLNRPPRVYSVGEGFEETTWFSAPPYS